MVEEALSYYSCTVEGGLVVQGDILIKESALNNVHCVPRTTVSFQKHTARSKIDRFPKIFHWMITNALTFVFKL